MNPRERVAAAMRLQKPDRVPVMCQPSWGFLLLQNPDIDPIDLWHDQSAYAEALCRVSERFGFDGVLISAVGTAPLDRTLVSRIDRDHPDGPRVAFANGDACVYCSDDLPRYSPAAAPELDFDSFDPATIPATLSYLPPTTRLRARLCDGAADRVRVIHEARARAHDDLSIHGEMYAPQDFLIDLFGVEQAMVAMLEEPGKCGEILMRFAAAVAANAQEQIDAGVDAMKLSAPWSGQKFVSPSVYRDLVIPSQAPLAEVCRRNGVPCYCHTCGAIGDRLEAIIDAGFDGLECLDPPPLGNVELEDAVRRVGGRAFIKGNIDPVNVLLKGTEEEVREDARRRLRIGMTARGFILSTACAVAPRTPARNLELLAEVAREEGVHQ